MFPIHFLSANDGNRLTKSFRMTEEGLQKESYPHVYELTSHEVNVDTIEDFFAQLFAHAEAGHCLLKGQLDRPLRNESRAGHTNSDAPTEWMVLDNDNLHDLEPQALMDLLGLGDIDHIVQYSSTAGIEPGKNGYHIFFLLDQPWSPGDLKLVLRSWNLDHRAIREHFQLSRTNNSLRWPLDISVCQNDKLIYIAPPSLGPGVESTLVGDRIRLVKGTRRAATLPTDVESDDVLKRREQEVLNRLRQDAGLPPKDLATKTVSGQLVASCPDQAQVTGQKEERGFVYLNLNGGDSWGYFHPTASPEVLYNFKGEPKYLVKELLPDYYPEATKRAEEARGEQQMERVRADMTQQAQRLRKAEEEGVRALLAFRDKRTDQYYAGWIDQQDRSHEFHPIGTKRKINEFMVQHGVPPLEIVPTVDFRFAPANDALHDFKRHFINRYTPPKYRKQAQRRVGAEVPPGIARVILHALGGDPDVVEHFLNWSAVIFLYRERTQTAWILQGTTGTGKGLLFSTILRPLIGEDYCREVNLANLEEQFNGFAEQTLFLFVDEVDTDQVKDMPKLMARFKSWITEPRIALRAMRQDLREVPNHLNLTLSSNRPNSMRIEANDRRFNVCPRQERKLLGPDESGEDLVAQIERELQEFADYLMSREADRAKARRALDNEPKRVLQRVTQTAIEEVAQALRRGDLAYFMDHRPPHEIGSMRHDPFFNGARVSIREVYREFLNEAIAAAEQETKHVVQHEPLFAVFELLVGNMPSTKTKLTKRLGHQSLSILPHTQGSTSVRGLGVDWRATREKLAAWRALLDEEAKSKNPHAAGRPPRSKDTEEDDREDGTR